MNCKTFTTTTMTIALFFAALLTTARMAHAEVVHPDIMGDTVWFRDITESSPTEDPEPLYGDPLVVGDSLDFPTTGNFAASSLGGNGSDQTDGKLTLMIEAKPGFTLKELLFSEIGFTALDAPFGGDAFTSIDAFVVINPFATINNELVALSEISASLDFLPSDQFQHSIDAVGSSFSSEWMGEAMIELPPHVTKVSITLDNILYAATTEDAGTRAFIDKKDFDINVHTHGSHPIPEPATLVLGLLGLTAGALGMPWKSQS